MKDIIQEKRVNFNFINNISNTQNLTSQSNYLITQLLTKSTDLNKRLIKYIDHNNQITFNSTELHRFMQKRKEFLNHLYLVCHMTSGSPLRKSEMLNITFKNSLKLVLRNIYYDEQSKLIMINTFYHKNQAMTQKSKNNIRFLCRKASDILILYLLYFNPLYEFILIQTKQVNALSCYLFNDKNQQFNQDTMSDFLSV